MVDLSIIIISYNTNDLLFDCLKSIYKAQKPPKGLEVIVVDNDSHDGSVSMVKKEFPQVTLIANRDNKGFAAANNQGISVSQGNYLLFLNSDTKISSQALVKPLKYLKKNPHVGGLTVKLLLPTGKLDPDNHRGFLTPWTAFTKFSGLGKLFPKSKLFNNYFQSYRNFNKTHAIDVTAGSYLMMPAKLMKKLNGWDETYFFYGEDIDLSYRIHQAGYKIIYYPKVTTIHYKGASSGLRKESKKIARPPKETRIKVAKSSTQAMKIFYKKFYQDKYPFYVRTPVLAAITLMGWVRILKHKLT